MKFISTHLGIGDAIIQNGLVRTVVSKEPVLFPTLERCYESVAFMFRDISDRVVVIPVTDNEPMVTRLARRYGNFLLLGRPYGEYPVNGEQFDETLYRHSGVPFESKWSMFKVERSPAAEQRTFDRLNPHLPYAFVHEDRSRRLNIDRHRINRKLAIVEPSGSTNIFDYWMTMEKAEEVHVIVSSFFNLADVSRMSVKKYVHTYARPWHHPSDDVKRDSSWIAI